MAISAALLEDSADVRQWRDDFSALRYGIVRQVISPDAAQIAAQYMQYLHAYYEPLLLFDASQQSFNRYNDPLGESMLAAVAPRVTRLTGLDLLPTYSFLRMYRAGGVLSKHIDRPSCEVSGTMFLGGDAPWPICIEVDGAPREVHLGPGDLMVYRGCKVPHWRERFAGQYSVHVFLHFVEAQGSYAHLIYDEREGLGAPQRKLAPQGSKVRTPLLSSGTAQQVSTESMPGIGRNRPCPCGSGKRFKNCHGAMG